MGVAENFAGIVKQQTVPGPGQTLLLQRGQSKHHASDQVVPFGFKINGYAQDVATVTFYGRQSGVGVRCTTAVQWAGGATGDWLLRLAPDGSGLLDCERLLADLQNSDFVAWGPNQ
jgi:hypothetical protein